MRIFFLDQSSQLGGAELCLADIATYFQSKELALSSNREEARPNQSLVGIFTEGDFPDYLRQRQVPVKVLATQEIHVQKNSGIWAGLRSLNHLVPLILMVARLSKDYDLIYANTQKALVVGAIASILSQRPLVYHLHDIVSADHFSAINRQIIVALANRATLVIANSTASRDAFIAAGGNGNRTHRVYNGFHPDVYSLTISCTHPAAQRVHQNLHQQTSQHLHDEKAFIVGHFSRLSPWKGQHILLEALPHCPKNVVALLIGGALFGEDDYVNQLHQTIDRLDLHHRVHFLGFRSDVPALMQVCDLIVHTSIAPEPFGRVIIEGMLSRRPVIAAAAGGAVELIEHKRTGWLCPPGDPARLAEYITQCYSHPDKRDQVVTDAYHQALERFSITQTNEAIASLLQRIVPVRNGI